MASVIAAALAWTEVIHSVWGRLVALAICSAARAADMETPGKLAPYANQANSFSR
jgi:hypothetical protein